MADVVEALDGLAQRLVEIREQALELTYTLATLIGQRGRVGTVVGRRAGDEDADSPEVLAILVVECAVVGLDDGECLAHRIGDLALDMLRHGLDVVHHRGHVGEDVVILALEDVVGRRAYGVHHEGVVDKTLAQGGDALHLAFEREVRSYLSKFFLCHICFI